MLKALQILVSSSLSYTWKRQLTTATTASCFLSSTSINSFSCHPSPLKPTNHSLLLSPSFGFYSTRSRSKMDANSASNSSVAVPSAGNARKINFCQWCGDATKHEIPDGEEKMRAICTLCNRIAYQNPKMVDEVIFAVKLVVGCLIEHDNKVLLCKRNIQPSFGLWTLPAGYLEIGESAAEGAMRETWEEACAEVEVVSPFAHLDIPLIGQTYIIFLAKLKKPHFSPGPESQECCLFSLDDVPFDSLAFSSMVVTLKLYVEDVKSGRLKFHYGTINKRPGTSPSDIHAYTLDHHLES